MFPGVGQELLELVMLRKVPTGSWWSSGDLEGSALGVQLLRGNWQQHRGKGSPGAPSSSLELGLAILPALGPAVTHSSGCPNQPSPTQEQPQEWDLPCTGAWWCPD